MGAHRRRTSVPRPSAGRVAAVVALVTAAGLLLIGVGSADPGGATPASTTTVAPTAKPVPVEGTPCTSAARACVDLDAGEAWLLDGDRIVRGPVQIQTGDEDDPTPQGVFSVQWKAERYTSREYDTPMPYSVFFAPGGIAFHEGPQDTYSAGCVKLVHDDAVAWFHYLHVGDEVQVR